MPIYEYNGKRYNIPEDKAQELITRMPGAKLIDESPANQDKSPQQPQSVAQNYIYVPQVNQTTFDSEMVRQAQAKQLGVGFTIGQKQNIADVFGDMYDNRDLTRPVPKNAAQKQDGFWGTMVGDFGEKIGAGALNLAGGLAKVHENTNPIMLAARKLLGKDGDMVPDAIPQQLLETGKEVSERGDRYGLMVDPETGETRKKTYSDLWKEGKRGAAVVEAMLTATESLPTSAMAMVPGAGLTLIGLSVAGQTYNELDNNPETKDLPEWKKILNASASGAIEGLTERLGAKVDMKVFEPVLKKMGEQTVKGILKKGGIGALIQTITEGGEEVISQLGGNVVDYATGVSDEYKPFEGVKDSFVYGAAGGAQFGGVTGAGTIYRAVEQHKANVETAKAQNTLRLWESINKKRSQALPALNNEKQQLEAELGDLTTLSYEEVLNSPESTPELIQARERYDIVNAEYEGVMENLKREVDDFIAPQVQAIQDVAKDGVITELNVGTEDAPDIVYLVKGDVAINEDGTIDPAATSPMLTVKNSEGQKRMIARSKIATAQQDGLNTTIEGIKQRAYEKLVRPVADKMEGKTHFQNGEKVEYTNSKGETVAGTVTAKQNNTVTVVGLDGKKTETFTEDELAQRLVGETIDDVRTRDVIQVQMNGQVYDADVTNIQDGIAELHIPSFPEAAGRYQDVTAAELRRMRVMPQAQVQVDSKTTQETAENVQATAGQTAQSVSETAETGAESQITPQQKQRAQPSEDTLQGDPISPDIHENIHITMTSDGYHDFTSQGINTINPWSRKFPDPRSLPRETGWGTYENNWYYKKMSPPGSGRPGDNKTVWFSREPSQALKEYVEGVMASRDGVNPTELKQTAFEDFKKSYGVQGESQESSSSTPNQSNIEAKKAQITPQQAEAESKITPEQQVEAEKQEFMQSLPVVESGKNKGQIDQSQMTPEQNIRYFEYQYGQDKAVQAARKMSENLTKRIKKEQEKLDNDPFNIAQNELVEQLQAQMEAYKNYAFARMQEQTEKNIAEQSVPSVTQAKQQRATRIQQEEAGRTGTAEPTIKEKWDAVDKIEGIEDVITLASGEKIPGRYILTTADAPSPSHDIERNFAKTNGFPTNDQGNTVNDRDYEADKTAQTLVQQRANVYDEQAVQNPVVVSRDGIVISGNDRTMAGKIAARNGTDKAYVDYITKYADRWGFTPEMVASMPAPRIVFVPDVDLPYNTATFAKFNAEDKKTQSTLERAIKSSKSVSREIIIPISGVIEGYKSLAEFYENQNATHKVLQVLTRNGIIQTNEIPRLMDGDVFSAEGRSFLETLLLGAVLQEQALREVDAMRSVRQSLMRTMPQLARNASLSEYSIIPELNNAIHLLYQAKRSGSKVKLHLMQTNVFEASPAEVFAEAEKLIAIMLDNAKDTEIRNIFESYNKEAAAIESGQSNMFDGVLTKPALLTLILNKYGQQAEVNQQDGSPSQSDGESEGNRSGQPTESGSEQQQQPKGQQSDVNKQESSPKQTIPDGENQQELPSAQHEQPAPQQDSMQEEGVLSDQKEESEQQQVDKNENQPEYGANNKIITQERYNELREQMRKKLNNLNVGFDPEVFAIGAQMAMFHIESGAHKFADFAKRMVDDLGDAIRPYLKASYEGARAMPGMEELSKTMDPYKDVVAFDVNQSFEEVINNIEQNEQGTRSTEAIEAETETIESASDVIRSESENVGSDQQRAGDVKEQADEQVKKVETLLIEVEQKLANLKLSGKNYSTDGIAADYPINVLAKGPIKKDATAYVKAVAAMTGLEHDTDRKGKREILNVNIAPSGGDVTFVLWSKKNPDYGVYVSVPYSPDYRNDYDNYKVDGSILWRVTTKQDKWTGLSNQYVNSDVTAQEMAETLLKGLNQELRSRGLEQEINQVEKAPETVKNKRINKKTSAKVAKNQTNMLSLFGEEDDVSPINTNQDERVLQGNSQRLHQGSRAGSGSRLHTGGTRRNSGIQSNEIPGSDGTQQRSTEREGGLLPGDADVLNTEQEKSIEDSPALVPFEADRNDVEAFNKSKKYADNIEAIRTVLTLITENRKATPDEKKILSRYVGFGGLKEVLLDPDSGNWNKSDNQYKDQVREVIELANRFDAATGAKDTFNKIRGSILNAHYTSATVIEGIYNGLKKIGFKKGNILEPSAGIGNFITYMPESIKGKSNISAVELDNLTGNILKYLHDNVAVQISGIENAVIPNNSQDLVISNVPFGNYKVYDKKFKGEKEQFLNRIHNYFFAKAIDQAREGGLIVFVTSKGVLDAPGNEAIRRYLSQNAEFLGAVRLPSNSFQKTANTQVTTDVIFLQKSKTGNSRERFIGVKEVDAIHKDGGTEKVSVNEYFINHPENMLGTIEAGGLYSRNDYSLIDNGTSKDLSKVIRSMLPENVFTPVKSAMGSQANDIKQSIEDVKEGNIVILNGSLFKKEEGVAVEIKINEPAAKIEKYIDLRNKLMGLIYSEYINIDSKELDNLRSQLNKSYDEFVKKYGKLEKSIKKIVKEDADGYNVQSLEIDGRKADIFTKRTISPIIQKTHVESIDEAIIASLSETAGIDMERISQLMGKSMAEVVQEAKGKLFEEPGGGFVTRDEYLSGNVKKKLREAKKAVEEGFTEFQYNIDELERVIPADIPAVQIEARAGSRWIPASVYTDFAQHILKSNGIVITYSKAADQYSHNGRVGTVDATTKYGTSRVNGADILVHALHINPPKVFDYEGTGSDRRAVLNQEETDKAMQKYRLIRDTFEDWVYKSQDRRTLLSGIYNERFNTNVKRRYDGSHLNIPGINGVVLRDHQKDAIWMLLQNGGGVIDHLVGAGKTFVMVAGTMEMKRTGVVKKPMIIALKSTIPQIVESYRSAYPMAKVLAPMEKDFEKKNRMRLFSKIANNEWDCIIMSHENYGKIPHEKEIQEELINDELEQLREEESQYKAENNRSALKGVLIRIKNLEARLDKLADISKDNSLTFEQMGIDHIMVDESQQFKNLSYLTKQRGIAGLGKAEGSKRSFNLLVGLRYLQRKNKADKAATFLSGTPITNSIVEMYSLLNYLRPNKMAELGFTSFDSWATTFANPTMDIEFTVTNNIKQKTRFREFMNVPELSMLYTEIADIRTDENLKLDKPKMKGNGYTVEEIKMNEDQIEFGKRLTKFAETKDGELIGRPPLSEKEMSAAMLLATNLSSKMAIDMRLISNEYQYNPEGKIAKLVNNVVRIFNETSEYKGTQLIFSDLGTPKNKTNKTALLKDYLEDEVGLNQDSLIELFGDYNAQGHRYPALSTVKKRMIDNLEMSEEEVEQIVLDSENSVGSFDVYNEVKFRLIEQGIPEEQIVFIHDYNTNKRKEDLFKKVNEGEIRIVLGSTQKLGTGVNVQERVSAVHHVDVPWTPASMEQRNGRAIRQGNWVAKKHLNNELPVYAYATERTLDAYKYQLLHTKQRFLNQVKSGDIEDRVLKEGDGDAESGVNYAELVAMLSGNKDILLKARLEEKVAQLKRQKRNFEGELYESIENKKEKEDLIPIIEKNISESKENVKEITDKAVFDDDGKLVITSFNGTEYKDDVKGEKGDKDKKIETARIKVAKAAIEYAEKWLKKAQYGDITTINIGGYDILMQADRYRAVISNNSNLFDTDKSLRLVLKTPNGSEYEFNFSVIPGVLLNNIQKIITDRIPDVLSRQQSVLEKTKDDIKAYDEIIKVGDKWSKQEEYDNALKELKEVNDRLDADIKKNESGTPQEESEGEENDNEDVRFRTMDEAGFYSTVEDALEKIKQEKGTPGQFKAMLLKNGAKQAELDYMGWDDFASDINVVTKTDIQNWIDQNRIEVQEVEKGKGKEDDYRDAVYNHVRDQLARIGELDDANEETIARWYNNPTEENEWSMNALLNENNIDIEYIEDRATTDISTTRYSQYTLPGGKNYRELLLTKPVRKTFDKSKLEIKRHLSSETQGTTEIIYNGTSLGNFSDDPRYIDGELRQKSDSEWIKYAENAITFGDNHNKLAPGDNFKSVHFDEPNILAHIRFNDREVNGERVLFLEEIQSDWAQEGKKKGFKSDSNEGEYDSVFAELVRIRDEKEAYRKEIDPYNKSSIPTLKAEYPRMKELDEKENQLIDREYELRKKKNGVSDMPFKKTDQWVNLALRRMMMYAAENGYDRIAWTTGQQQADRYDLSKQVDEITYRKDDKGKYDIGVYKNGELLVARNHQTESDVENIIGKELAKKVVNDEATTKNGKVGFISGLDLKVGGEGMKAFYDQIVPKAAKKLAKPFGAEVETINISNKTFNIRRKNNGYYEVSDIDGNMVMNNVDPAKIDQWKQSDIYVQSIPITDELREMAPGGMPLFRTSKEKANEAYALREWKRAENAAKRLAAKMGVEVELLETTEGLPKKKRESKGWYSVSTKKITIVMPNHRNSMDVQATLLHEAVGHHGLRELFGNHFNTFLDNVYNNAEEGIRDRIDMIAEQGKFSTRKATEEYLSQLAEDPRITETEKVGGIASFFWDVRRFFFEMLAKAGFNPGFRMSNNELKYILWRSYNNLAEPGRYRSIVDHAKDVAMQDRLKVGNYAERGTKANVAEEPVTTVINAAKHLESDGAQEYTELNENEIPENTQVAYKLMRYMPSKPGMLFPLYAKDDDAGRKGFKKGKWYKAEVQSVKIGGNDLANRPGIHAVNLPLFLQGKVNVKGETRVWAKVLMPAMNKETQAENDASPILSNGQREGIRGRLIGANEAYNFKTNPSATGADAWPIAGSMKIVEVISDKQIEQILRDNGKELFIDLSITGDPDIRFRTIGEEVKRADDLFDNIDNLKSVVKDYGGFLGKVFDGAPNRGDMLAYARENGFDKLGEGIEQYLADVEDPAELSRIKELLGVDMPDNALRYMLWRNANPNENTVVWKAKEAVKRNELDENILFSKGEVPSSIKDDKYEQRIRSRHNRGFRSLMYGIEEGWFDRMASLRILQNAITGGKAVSDRANAYMLENQLTSRNTADIRYYTKNLVDPFVKQIHDIFGRNMNAADEYMNAKHGLERNDLMAEEEAKRKYAKNIASLNKEYADEKIDEDTYNEKMEAINGKIEAYAEKLKEEKDYSGLTAIAAERGREDFKAVAQEIVAEIEGGVPKEDIDALWSRVNSATKWILDKQYNAGIMTKDIYEKIRGMYKYYVPLRGFEEVTATDLYEYIDNSPSNFEGTVKKAYGRTSKAESPTATIMSMGESGIMQANRNRMKQAFYRLVATNPSNYASIEDVWFVETADGFEERFPDISPSASADEVLEAIADFNNDMAELAAEGKAFQGRNKLDIGVKIMKAQASEHVVRVWVAGEEKVIFINGNPRAAQAINGLVQKDLLSKDNLRNGVHYWSRQMAANFTSRNPAFMVTNLMRDVQFAVVSAAVKEGIPYSSRLAKNVFLVGKTISANVFKDGNKDNAEFQKYWEEFEANGGETGYANLHSIDFNRKYVNKKLREFSDQRDFLKPFRAYAQFMENGNRMIEDMSRFATYVTSRQMGRSIERSVSDAKEITINFNRKGSGGFGANLIHSFYLFSNPALQSMRLMGMLAKNHPVRFTAMLSSAMGAGFMVPMINELLLGLFGDDDDKEKYQNITPWVRRNNLVLYVPGTKGKFITLMLPHELRSFYGIGEMAYEKANGGLRRENMVVETAKQMTAMLPIDPMGGPDWWVPDALKPPYQAYVTNRNFMDRPIYRKSMWNEHDPEWTKAYKGTPELLVEAAKGASDMTGGDDVVPGWANANPARAYHIFGGYLGGFMTTYTDMSMIAFNLLTGRDVRANDVPVVNKLIRTSDEKTKELRINSEYFYYIDWIREYEHRTKGYEKRVQDPEYRDKYMDVMRDKEQRMYNFAKGQIALIDQLKDYDEEKANEMKEQFVRKMWEYEDQD